MNIKPLFAVVVLVTATAPAFAADPAPLTRAEVHQSVLAAQAAGQLHFGELGGYPYFDDSAASTVSRAAVRAAAVAQNATHPLAGEAGADIAVFDPIAPAPSMLTRMEVHDQVIAARKAGTLPPPGDDIGYPYDEARSGTGHFDAEAHPRLASIAHWFAGRSKTPVDATDPVVR